MSYMVQTEVISHGIANTAESTVLCGHFQIQAHMKQTGVTENAKNI